MLLKHHFFQYTVPSSTLSYLPVMYFVISINYLVFIFQKCFFSKFSSRFDFELHNYYFPLISYFHSKYLCNQECKQKFQICFTTTGYI